MENVRHLRNQLVDLIKSKNAHLNFDQAVKNLPPEKRTVRPAGLPYSVWELVEHIRISQWDIVEFCINPTHESPSWPEGYWPDAQKEYSDNQWEESLRAIRNDRQRIIDLVSDNSSDLFTPFKHGDGQNLLREAMLVADHTAYHTGQIVVVRRLLNEWD